jgi:aspartyl/asparaginyl beta-hydroxylase (cupin superfamily)
MYFDPDVYPFAVPLRVGWGEILREYQSIRDGLVDWPEPELHGEGWKVFGLFDFPHGHPIAENIRRCPFTASLVERHVPGHGAAGFSVLRPATRLKPHHGYAGAFFRCQLGLIVPPGDCGLKVGDEVRGWEVGGLLVFDDRVLHDAWNLTHAERVVLLFDFVPHVLM